MHLRIDPFTRELVVDGTLEQRAACELALERIVRAAEREQRFVPVSEDTLRAVRAGAVAELERRLAGARDSFERGRLLAAVDDARAVDPPGGGTPTEGPCGC